MNPSSPRVHSEPDFISETSIGLDWTYRTGRGVYAAPRISPTRDAIWLQLLQFGRRDGPTDAILLDHQLACDREYHLGRWKLMAEERLETGGFTSECANILVVLDLGELKRRDPLSSRGLSQHCATAHRTVPSDAPFACPYVHGDTP